MYKVSYYANEKKDLVFYKWFKTLKESVDFSNTLKTPEMLIEIKYYNANDPDQPKPTTMAN